MKVIAKLPDEEVNERTFITPVITVEDAILSIEADVNTLIDHLNYLIDSLKENKDAYSD